MKCSISVYYMMTVGDDMILRLRDVREGKNKTQAQMADFLGCSQQTYSRYENGKAQMSYQTLDCLADYFGTSIDYLLGRTDEKVSYPAVSAKKTPDRLQQCH